MPEETAIIEAPPEQPIVLADKKENAFLLPVKEDIAGFTCHSFSKARKGFVIATGNALLDTEKHLKAYKESHPTWEADSSTPALVKTRDDAIAKAMEIQDPEKQAEAIVLAKDEFSGNLEWSLMTVAVPDFMFHLTALAYLCVSSATDISKLVGKPREYFHQQATEWGDKLTDDQWDKLTVRAFQELVESNLGADFKVKQEESGLPEAPSPS